MIEWVSDQNNLEWCAPNYCYGASQLATANFVQKNMKNYFIMGKCSYR